METRMILLPSIHDGFVGLANAKHDRKLRAAMLYNLKPDKFIKIITRMRESNKFVIGILKYGAQITIENKYFNLFFTCRRPSIDRGIVTHFDVSLLDFNASSRFLIPFCFFFNFLTNVSMALADHSSCSPLCFHFDRVLLALELPVKKFAILDSVPCGRCESSILLFLFGRKSTITIQCFQHILVAPERPSLKTYAKNKLETKLLKN